MATPQPRLGALNSWKEIASYLGRGVRTVQRWEKYGLPVRRLGNGFRAPVAADVSELDRWFHCAQENGFASVLPTNHRIFREELLNTVEQARLLRAEMIHLRESGRPVLAKLMATIQELEKSCTPPAANLLKTNELEAPVLSIYKNILAGAFWRFQRKVPVGR